jgi:hypothetical protein
VAGPKTPSGRPEVQVRVSAKEAKARLVSAYSAAGFNVEASDDMGFTIAQPLTAFQEAMIGRGTHRIRFNMSENGDVTTIRATSFIIGANTTETSTGKAGSDIQRSLENIFKLELVSPRTSD